jgi:flagellum-specific peptidoglycan hydrolase FlgJ
MGYTIAQAKQFIEHIAPLMQKEAKARGYKIVSTAIAQAVIEGAAGTSLLAKNYHNHFGLKCGSKWKGASVNMKTKEEYTVGTLTTIKDNFRAYANDEEGVKGYYDFINTSRYANLKTATTPKQYAEYLKSDGYATSSSYVNTLVNTVSKYGLEKYDEIPELLPDKEEHRTLVRGSRGEDVRSWQTYLNLHGFNCGEADGVYGKLTEQAVIEYQKSKGFEIGFIGPKTWETVL